MLKKMFAATTALIMIFSSFAVSYAEEAAEKQYIVRLKTSDVQLMNADGSRHFFDIADESTLDELLREDLVEWYEEDYSVELFDESEQNTEKLPEEPVPTEEHIKKYDESKWDLEMIRADFTYDINCEGQEIKIGVIDSGIADHADLKGNILEGHNYISGTYDTKDTYGHGTFVSGIIASQDDREGIIGVVPKVRLVPLKCFDGKTFRPDEPITREQAAAMLQRYAEFAKESNSLWNETNILSYEDFDSISDWAIPSLQWAVGAGVMKGSTDSTINPIENITRAEIAQMLVNYMGAVENYKNEINKED